MTVEDLFKRSALETVYSSDLSFIQITMRMGVTCLFAVFIFVIYRLYTRKVFYNNSYNIAIAGVAIIVSAIVIALQSSLVVSLGMIGALSIVRFRTAIKEPIDLVFMFWSVSIGILCGAGLTQVAVFETFILTIGVFLLNAIPVTKTPMLLVVHANDKAARGAIVETVAKQTKSYSVKSQTVENNHLDMIIEVRTAKCDALLNAVGDISEVSSFSLVRHNGETVF